MPLRAVLSPKFTYSQGHGYIRVYYSGTSTDAGKNGMFDPYSNSSDISNMIYFPTINFPEYGEGHSKRKANRITVTSIRLKMHFQMYPECLEEYGFGKLAPNQFAYPSSNDHNVPANSTMFAKFRLFLIQVDDDLSMTRAKFYNWFLATHCFYREPTEDETLCGPNWNGGPTESPGPTSVHSNVLRTTTEWTGKFNVLADRKFTVRPTHPSFDIDMTIPLRKQFVFDEKYDSTSTLLYPKLYCFILPPLSWEVDVDPISSSVIKAGNAQSIHLFHVYHWAKLNFVDL